MLSYQKERNEIVSVMRNLFLQGFIQANVGNASVKVGPDLYLITPKGKRKGELLPEEIVLVNGRGEVIEGNLVPSIELNTHLSWYSVRSDINAIIHAHPPFITAASFYMASEVKPLMTEIQDYVGKKLISVPYRKAGSEELCKEVAEKGGDPEVFVIVLQKHGVLVGGKSLEEALNRLELIEFDTKVRFLKELSI
ncbi:MAG: class II aldolase/adducin family protein [candidate division WOR-3 bacterium]